MKDLGVAWIHVPGQSTRGLQSMPLVADGVLYYTAPTAASLRWTVRPAA